MFSPLVSTTLLVHCFSLASGHAVELVQDGNACAEIVVPDSSYPVLDFAIQELQYHIERASGTKLPVRKESDPNTYFQNKIFLGLLSSSVKDGIDLSALPPAGYLVCARASRLYLVGRDTSGNVGGDDEPTWHGTLWAVYDFLENELGVRWLWPGRLGEYIPTQKTIRVPPCERHGAPRFQDARLIVPQLSREATFGWADSSNHDRFLKEQDTWLLRHRLVATKSLQYGHTFGDYWARFHKTNPEFFALLPDGNRIPLAGDRDGTNVALCLSQPSLWAQIVADWQEKIKGVSSDSLPPVNVCENDTPGLCTCPSCRAWDSPDPRFDISPYWSQGKIPTFKERFHGKGFGIAGTSTPWGGVVLPEDAPSLSDRYAMFYNAVLQLARGVCPHATVFGYAYANYWEAPKQTHLHEGVIISFVPPLWFPYTTEMSRTFRKNWQGWRHAGAQLVLRPNLMLAGHNLPIFYAKRFAADFSYAAKRGMIGTTFDSLCGAWATQGPTLYTIARIHTHPEWKPAQILDEYYRAFGPAKVAVRRYFEFWEKISNKLTEADVGRFHEEEGGGGFKDYVLIADRICTPEVLTEARRLLQIAQNAAQDNDEAAARAAFLEKGLRNVELTLETLSAYKTYKRRPDESAKKAAQGALEKLMKYRASVEHENICDMGYLAYREMRGAGWKELLTNVDKND
ncbi:MAG TPA: DUF4838 domain-containing protein [Candidatus Hydrogenedentes bacterium]|nr:DUF4838 domain-containing protein [Candidatus Hydrogenedentota bacterium]HOL77135.1 DUF4838 domain-containing protein [Candidatus Hydrogenedentota bacterium]HPO86946.1 DUF4838 domain-containing protein [Candidatus Hydrogenedentota bacterium]